MFFLEELILFIYIIRRYILFVDIYMDVNWSHLKLITLDDCPYLWMMFEIRSAMVFVMVSLRCFWGKYHMRPACNWFGNIQIDRNTHILIQESRW